MMISEDAMPRFFVRQQQIADGKISILGDDAFHISRALRMAAGEHITVCDMQGTEYDCELISFSDGCVTAQICAEAKASNEPLCRVHLFQALPKGDKLDTVIQKAVECGVSEITPFESERCIVRIRKEGEAKKEERRSRIAAEAAKQCGRSVLPTVHPAITYSQALSIASSYDLCLFCYEGDGTRPLGAVLSDYAKECNGDFGGKSIALFVGSEGGFSQKEAEAARALGMMMTGLGKRILRTETASGFVLACLVMITELN